MSPLVTMKGTLLGAAALGLWMVSPMVAQTPSPTASPGNTDDKLDAISKKIDEQNRKIDLLSQEILKLEMQLSNARPGVLIGEGAPNYSPSPSATDAPHPETGGTTHMVARGETLTSIAKMYNVSVIELQKFNHIENDRKLQIGQTLNIPGPGGAAASPSPTPSASPGTH